MTEQITQHQNNLQHSSAKQPKRLLKYNLTSIVHSKPSKTSVAKFGGTTLTRKEAKKTVKKREPRKVTEREARSMSTRTKSKIRQKLYAWYYSNKTNRSLTFITLTFINETDDETAIKALNNFLTWVRKTKENFIYLWVAERQENGRIHFHIISNKYLQVKYYNQYWISCQNKQGIHHDNTNLNPLDVRHIKQVKTLAYYVTKYITKNTAEFHCSTWNCSKQISQLATSFYGNDEIFNYVQANEINYYEKDGKKHYPEPIHTEYATIYPIFNKKIPDKLFSTLHFFNNCLLTNSNLEQLLKMVEAKICTIGFS